jgi:hypothetical protein
LRKTFRPLRLKNHAPFGMHPSYKIVVSSSKNPTLKSLKARFSLAGGLNAQGRRIKKSTENLASKSLKPKF